MTQEQTKQRIDKLKKVINHHRYLYHVLDKQEISDSAIDSLKKELFDLEQKYPKFITPDSPTQRVEGSVQDGFEKAKHTQPMLSFNDAFSQEDIFDWEERFKKLLSSAETKQLGYFCEHKIDGLAVSLVYKKGVLIRGATRGDGKIGEDVTVNLKTIESIPLRLEKNIDCEVRGEVFMTKKAFNDLNKQRVKKDLSVYANPRNTAAGTIRQLDSQVTADRNLSFLAWQLLGRATQEQEYRELKDLGFKPVEGKHCKTLEQVFEHYREIMKKREKLPYHIDGIVVGVNNNKIFEKLGTVGKAPRGSVAFKFPLMESQTIVEDIKVQVGRTGAVTPVAILKPVRVGGVTITRATLHNEDEIKRLGIKVGDTVIVGRAGDVIPQVVKVLKEMRDGKEKAFHMPKKCPDCSTDLIKKQGEVVWRCPNHNCQVRKRKGLYHFVSRGAFNIDGLGPKIIDQLLKQNIITTPADIFELKQGDLIPLERFAEKSAENLVQAIDGAKDITLGRFIFALGIRGVGEETGIDLANYFLNIENISQATKEQLLDIQDIGPETAENIYEFFQNEKNKKEVSHLIKAGIKIQKPVPPPSPQAQKLKSKTFVLTGSMESLTRDEVKEKIRALGGDISSSVSKNIDFVVAGANPGSKLTKAEKLNIKILKEKDFLKMLN
ncbi:MAG: NAD-dependent DNA ligase LigA [Parcubacteria group bacterium]|nr:NAD-dependent DNA ligase LigA [Parcubacteria group bacterium]